MSARVPERTLASAGEAERVIADLNAILDRLEATVADETALVRAGRLGEAAKLGENKAGLSHRYAVESGRIVAARELIARTLPDQLAGLRKRNAAFNAALQTNLMVLATAHAVSEGIIRGVSGELARTRAPSTYGASGRANLPSAKASPPLALSRTL